MNVRLFGANRAVQPAKPHGTAMLASGRRLRSTAGVGECRQTLEGILSSYRPRRYAELPHVVDTGYQWYGEGHPECVVSCTDARDEFLLVTIGSSGTGSEIGIFPLGSGDQRLQMPLPGHWKMRDSSLSSIGTYPAGTVALREPRIPDHYAEEILTRAGFPATPNNLAVLKDMLTQQFLVKAHQFISSQDAAFADAFVARHRDSTDLRAIVHDLGTWNPGVLPYIQDLPLRIRALLLEPEIRGASPMWAEMRP